MTTKVAKLGGVKRSVLLQEVQDIVDLCFERYGDTCLREISNMTGLSLGTLYKYRRHNVGVGIRFSTIQAMAVAAGLRVVSVRRGVKLYVTE